jgi:Kef-type K+ transport system membrane component KefB
LFESNPAPRTYVYYVILLIMFAGGMWFVLSRGAALTSSHPPVSATAGSFPTPTPAAGAPAPVASTTFLDKILQQRLRSTLSILLFQIIVIIVAAKLIAGIFRKIGQPPVMGEMVAGILLGPSVLGLISPPTMTFLFPPASMGTLGLLSQIGVVLFMFVVGMELDVQHLREKAAAAIMISHASIIVPFLLGTSLALFLYPILAPAGTTFTPFALFIGIAMSITAFPVLARILEDQGLTETRLGSTAIACAAIDDVTAWCILAFVIATVKSSGVATSIVTIALVLLFVIVMLLLVKPRIGGLITRGVEKQKRVKGLLAGILAFVLACAWFTESIGIHALFGAFLAGVIMPSDAAVRFFLRERLEAFGSAALLPLFFVFTGLRTEIRLINDASGWYMCGAIILVAIAGKLGGSMLMARWIRMSWRDSYAIGVLMNTRGLIELVVLNIGYDLGILSARIFVMLVIMALVTTFMTAPLLSLVIIKK